MYNALINFLNPSAIAAIATETIGGVQSGTLTAKEYTVESDILVLEGETLTIDPGAIFNMKENVMWEIQGTLTANGTSGSKIQFKLDTGAGHWHGVKFMKSFVNDTASVTVDTVADTISTTIQLETNYPIFFTTTGTLPAPLQPNQRYYNIGGNQIALRMGGTAIDITDTGSGTHTAHRIQPSSVSITSGDSTQPQSMTWCVFEDADTSDLPTNYNLAYRPYKRGGAIYIQEIETITLDNLEFYRCGAEDRGGAVYLQGLTSTSVPYTFNDWYSEDCLIEVEWAATFASAHGQAGVNLNNMEFRNGSSPPTADYPFTADASTDRISISNPLGLTLVEDWAVKNLGSTGTLPGGLAENTAYFMVNISGDTFQVATTPRGTPIDITSAGTGSHNFDILTDYYTFDTTFSVSNITFS